MVKECLKVSILFKTECLLKSLAPHNTQLVISNYSYVEVFLGSPHFDSSAALLNLIKKVKFKNQHTCNAARILKVPNFIKALSCIQ